MIKTDLVTTDIINKVAKEHNITYEEALNMIDKYYSKISSLLKQPDNTIKVNYIGRFSYSEAWKNKKESLRKNETI